MGKSIPHLMPSAKRALANVGENIKLARLRRKITTEMLSERAGITRATLRKAENGDPGVSLGVYAQLLGCLSLQSDLELLAKDDVLGRKLQDIELMGYNEDTSDKEVPQSLGKKNAATSFRRASLLGAVPDWLSVGEMKKIEELYEKAAELTNKTGVKHHVDHIMAIQGPNQGLHVLENLQILTATENIKKSNRI